MSQRDIDAFVNAADAFVAAVETFPSRPVVRDLRSSLIRVYGAVLSLPPPGETTAQTAEVPRQGLPWDLIGRFREALGDDDAFTAVFDATEPAKDDPYESSLGMEIGEIYEDLQESAALLRKYGPTPDCLWEIQFSFEKHWGHHAVHVFQALHQLAQYRD